MEENLYTTDCIRTYSGLYINVADPKPDKILIEDIAHSLAHQCRFGGHLPKFYSVARHSIEVANEVPIQYKFQALMHDASEAYLMDIPTPVKRQIPNYYDIELQLMNVISKKYGFDWPMSEVVKKADANRLQYEWDNIMLKRVIKNPSHVHYNDALEFITLFRQLRK